MVQRFNHTWKLHFTKNSNRFFFLTTSLLRNLWHVNIIKAMQEPLFNLLYQPWRCNGPTQYSEMSLPILPPFFPSCCSSINLQLSPFTPLLHLNFKHIPITSKTDSSASFSLYIINGNQRPLYSLLVLKLKTSPPPHSLRTEKNCLSCSLGCGNKG